MRKILNVIYIALVVMLAVGCSNSKNTALTRRVQAFKARYNTYYNGTLAFADGVEAQEKGNKDNYTEVIPLYITGNKATPKLGGSNFDRAIEKCQKTIKQHSITKRPKWTKNRPKTEKDKIWLAQREYNPFLWRAWMMLGEAQFRKGEYMEAASTFAYIQNVYFSKPNILSRARMLEAKCYAEMEWFYDAEDIIRRASRDSFPTNQQWLKAQVLADLQVRQKQYEEAIPNIIKAVKKEKSSLEKARKYFLLGQLCHKVGRDKEAYKYYTKCIRRNPPYELDFNARIQRTEAMSKGNAKQMIRKLKAMARNQKNENYLDQVYYAIGNIYLSTGDTTRAIWSYKDGVEKSTRNGIEKGVVWLHLGQLYWEKEKFVDAQKCYAGALGLFDKEHDDYKVIDERSKILEELLPFATTVELQDSLQRLANMDSISRMKVINLMIEELKKKEKEEARKAAEAEQAKNNPTRNNNNANQNNALNNRNNATGGVFYFYNPTTVEAGKKAFVQKWGERKNTDDWRRKNVTVLADFNDDTDDTPADTLAVNSDSLAVSGDSLDVAGDSLSSVGQPVEGDAAKAALADKGSKGKDENDGDKKKLTKEEKEAQKLEEYQQDPHRPEFYLKDIPFTEEQMAQSNKALVDGLFGSAVIYKDQMENLPLAERTFKRIFAIDTEFEKQDELYYNLFQLYSRMQNYEEASHYKERLSEEYPDNPHVPIINDPQFEFKGRYGKQIEDSLYQLTYEAYKTSDYPVVLEHSAYTEKEYPEGLNRPRFMFLEAMTRLDMGERDQFLGAMKAIVEKFPKSTVSELAGLYVKGLKEGRLLASGKFEMGSVWQRRKLIGEDGDSLLADTTFTAEKDCDFVFCIAYERDSVNENQLLYEMARYNFTNFTVRNFDLSFEKGDGIDMMQIRTFLNYDEAYIYFHRLMSNPDMATKLQGIKCFIISEDNLKKLSRGLSFADYFDFYDQTFDRIGSLNMGEDTPSTLDEPTELPEPVDPDVEETEDDEDNFIF